MPPTLIRFTRWLLLESAASASMVPASTIPGRGSASHSGSRWAASAVDANTTSICGGTPMRWRSCSHSLARTASSTSTMKPTRSGCPHPTITPRSGSLIVLLEVLLELAPLRHPLEEAFVEVLRRIHAAVAQQVVHRHHLTDYREILARVERHGDERQRDVEQLRRLPVEAGTIVLPRRVPVIELDHDFDALLLAHRADSEQRADVDQPHAADLHVVPCQLVTPADQHVVPMPRDVDDVVRHQAVTALHQIEHALALADPRAAQEQETHAEHVGERRVHRGVRRERLVEERLQAAIELGGLELGADHGHALRPRQLEQLGWRILPLRDDHARQIEPQEGLERRAA